MHPAVDLIVSTIRWGVVGLLAGASAGPRWSGCAALSGRKPGLWQRIFPEKGALTAASWP